LKYVKVFSDFAEDIEALSDEEAGRLFRAMLAYAEDGTEPSLTGAERILWPSVRKTIDRQGDAYQKKCVSAQNARASLSDISRDESDIREKNLISENETLISEQEEDEDEEEDEDKDEEEKKKEEILYSVEEEKRPRTDFQGIIADFNRLCPSLPRVKSVSEARKKAIRARLTMYSRDQLREAFERTERSSFLRGDNDRNWRADFDWIIRDRSMARILDGAYDDKTPKARGAPVAERRRQQPDDLAILEALVNGG